MSAVQTIRRRMCGNINCVGRLPAFVRALHSHRARVFGPHEREKDSVYNTACGTTRDSRYGGPSDKHKQCAPGGFSPQSACLVLAP